MAGARCYSCGEYDVQTWYVPGVVDGDGEQIGFPVCANCDAGCGPHEAALEGRWQA